MSQTLPVTLGPGLTLSATLSSHTNTVALFATARDGSTASGSAPSKAARAVFFNRYDDQQLERKDFRDKAYTVWASLQSIANEYEHAETVQLGGYRPEALPPPPLADKLGHYNRVSCQYRDALKKYEQLVKADAKLTTAAKEATAAHYVSLHTILSLAEILYVPASTTGGVVGEELLDWHNTAEVAPATQEGDELYALGRPWESDNFWDYLHRCVLRGFLRPVTMLLTTLSTSHPSLTLRPLAEVPLRLADSFPRSTTFRTEREFLAKVREWRRDAKDAQREFSELADEHGEDEHEGGLRRIMQMMLGEEEAIMEQSDGWREALAAWGVWVNPAMRRDGLADVFKRITRTQPIDATLTDEAIMASLVAGDVARALQQCNTLSLWLVSHLSDLLDKVGALPSANLATAPSHAHAFALPIAPPEQSLRDYFVLAYTDLLLSDPGTWRIVLDYLSTCGAEGLARMKHIILSVNLDGGSKTGAVDEDAEMDASEAKENEPPVRSTQAVEEVLEVCASYGLDDEMRKICTIYAELLITRKEYGTAVSFCIRAGDSRRIARIATRVLDEYVTNGQEAFIQYVDSIPTSLLRPSSTASSIMDDDEVEEENGMFTHPFSSRLSFLARYRDFFALYARDEKRDAASLLVLLLTSGVAPKGFYAIMLLDVVPLLESPEILISLPETYELLRILEELTAPIIKSGKDLYNHLDSLARVVGGPVITGDAKEKAARTQKAMKQLEVVRASLARHLGRCCCL